MLFFFFSLAPLVLHLSNLPVNKTVHRNLYRVRPRAWTLIVFIPASRLEYIISTLEFEFYPLVAVVVAVTRTDGPSGQQIPRRNTRRASIKVSACRRVSWDIETSLSQCPGSLFHYLTAGKKPFIYLMYTGHTHAKLYLYTAQIILFPSELSARVYSTPYSRKG